MARRNAAALFILVGASLLLYVSVQYGEMYWQQNQLEREWASQQQKPAAVLPGENKKGDAHVAPAVLNSSDGLTRLSIPRIDFSAVVVEGSGEHALLLGPGHVRSTPRPGEIGNSVISGHRDTFFRHIHELKKGDQILVQRNGNTFRYEVTGKQIVLPTDVSVMDATKDAELTLITCYPTYYIGPAPKRLIVNSRLVDDVSGKPSKQTPSAAPKLERAKASVAR